MSVGQLTQNNSYKLYLSTAETGININGTRLNSNGTDYELILPNDNDLGPLSVLLVDSIVDNKVYLKWSFPIDPPQAPFNYIECNTLKANIEVISRSLTIDNINGGTSSFIHEGITDIVYRLPLTSPTQNNQILSAQTNGNLNWVNPPVVNNNILPSDSFFFSYPDVILDQDTPAYSQASNLTTLIGNTYYKAFFSFTSKKTNPTGEFYCEVKPDIIGTDILIFGRMDTGIHPNDRFKELWYGSQSGASIQNDTEYTRNLEYIFKTPEPVLGIPYIQFQLISDIQAGGILEISQMHVVITPVKRI
jgi:hypothetical protein